MTPLNPILASRMDSARLYAETHCVQLCKEVLAWKAGNPLPVEGEFRNLVELVLFVTQNSVEARRVAESMVVQAALEFTASEGKS